MSGTRENQGKPPVNLILSKAWLEIAKVAEFGAKKYTPHNYRLGMRWTFFVDAGMRHLIKYCTGEKTDPESGLSHLAHVVWNFLALLEFEIEDIGENDIFPGYEKKEHSENAPGS